MTCCDINLANEVVWPRRQRVLAYHLLMLYLFVMSMWLIGLGMRSLRQINEGISYLSQSIELDQNFSRNLSGTTGLEKYAEKLKRQLEENTARIDSIDQALPPSVNTPLPALALMVNHSEKGVLYKFDFKQPTVKKPGRLLFDLVQPLGASQLSTSNGEFQHVWLSDPGLYRRFPNIRQLQVRRTELYGREVLITQYEASGGQ